VVLLRADRERLAESLGLKLIEFERDSCDRNSELGDALGQDVYQLKSILGRCVFLSDQDLCKVHSIKPYQCKYGPENFLQLSMQRDYGCMKGVDLDYAPEIEAYFFDQLIAGE